MLNVALTGNVAAGKSTVARLFVQWGATLIDSDALVADEQQPGSDTLAAIANQFGESMILPDGSLDRAALGQLVFTDSDARTALNAIVHPIVQARREMLMHEARRRGDRIVVSDIPLLFEVLDPSSFDLVVLVESPKSLRRNRLLDRGLSGEEADRLMAAQIPSEHKRALADIVIDNRGTLQELEEAVQEAWKTISARAAVDSHCIPE
jgi:dephospho-CoA kinase